MTKVVSGGGVFWVGVRETAPALREVDAGLAREVGRSFREGGRIVQQAAQSLVREQGLIASGEALRDIRVRSRGFEVSVVENARRDDRVRGTRFFPYPRLRRFWPLVMQPAAEQSHEAVVAATRQAIDDLTWIKGVGER
jgi:hypothetical protein